MKKLICYSLFESRRRPFIIYSTGAFVNQQTYKKFYPDFQTRFYLSKKLSPIGDMLKDMGAEVVYENDLYDQGGAMWRFKPMIDGDFDVVLFRDTDSRFSQRESNLVYKWLESEKNYHIIKDHPCHRNAILAGMWGAKKTDSYLQKVFQSKFDRLHKESNGYIHDEMFLQNEVYNHIKNDVLEHNSNINPELFSKEYDGFYIGMPVDEKGKEVQ